jgi:AcrR family transcriptional regulator
MPPLQRARSIEAKRSRETAILAAARDLGVDRGVRSVTLTQIAEAIGMHKSALLRYFETREEIFLRLTAEEWSGWGPSLVEAIGRLADWRLIGTVVSASLAARPLLCDLLGQTPMNLERNVSAETVRTFKLVTHAQVDAIGEAIRAHIPELSERDTVDFLAAATSAAGALWQMATPNDMLSELYRSDPRLRHALVEFEPMLTRILTAVVAGLRDRP